MRTILPSSTIYIASSKICPKERGVFARKDIQKGELIESCPVIPISENDTSEIAEESLIAYMYYFGEKKERAAVALGFGSIYNHTNTPNATYTEKAKEQTIEFIALRHIKKDEEIAVNYAKGNTEDRPLWFDKK